MARYEHLPIYKAAFDLAEHIEKIVRNFSRYHKYTLGTELRDCSRKVLKRIIEANASRAREPMLLQLRQDLEWFKVLARLCHEAGGFARARASGRTLVYKLVGVLELMISGLHATPIKNRYAGCASLYYCQRYRTQKDIYVKPKQL